MNRTGKIAFSVYLHSHRLTIRLEIEDGHLASIRDDEHVSHKGYLGPNAARLDHGQLHDDLHRHPLQCMPNGRFERIGWKPAQAVIASQRLSLRCGTGAVLSSSTASLSTP